MAVGTLRLGRPELLLRAANDAGRPMSVIEVALKMRAVPAPVGAPKVFALDPQYAQWAMRTFPQAHFCYCPLDIYDSQVRNADALHSMEQIDALLRDQVRANGGYALSTPPAWLSRTTLFAVGSTRLKPLLEFLFEWG